YILLLAALVFVSLLLILIVLMQKPRQEGLGATFGVDVTSQMFGSRATDVLQKGTVYFAVAFFSICLVLGLLNAHETKRAERLGAELAAGAEEEMEAVATKNAEEQMAEEKGSEASEAPAAPEPQPAASEAPAAPEPAPAAEPVPAPAPDAAAPAAEAPAESTNEGAPAPELPA